MDSFMIKDPNTDANSHSPTFFLHDGFSSSQVSDIEMMTIQSISYTSLKDLLSPRMQPGISSSPKTHDNYNNSSSWNHHDQEIPIKNPLVKQAALAYLQPMSSPRAVVEKGSFGTIKGMCGGESGCLSWLYDVIWKNVMGAAWENREEVDDEDEVD